jgi:hypothetical protein
MHNFHHIDIHPKPGYGVVICLHHQSAVLPSRVEQHFSREHAKDVSAPLRSAMQAHVNEHTEELHPSQQTISLPTAPVMAIPNLTIKQGAKCVHCTLIICGKARIENVKEHLRSAHSLKAKERSASLKATDLKAWYASQCRPVLCQQFFQQAVANSNAHKYFEVYEEAPRTPPVPEDAPIEPSAARPCRIEPIRTPSATRAHLVAREDASATLDRLRAQFANARARAGKARESARKAVPARPSRQTSPFLEHTQFLRCLDELEWDKARQYTTPCRPIDKPLAYLQGAVKSTVLAYQNTVAVTSRWGRIRVMQENSKEVPAMPLVHYQGYDLRHAITLVKIFTFFYHVLAKGWKKPSTLTITPRQQHAFQALQDHLDSCGDTFPTVDLKHKRQELTPVERLCHQFWLSLLEQTTVAHEFGTALSTVFAFIAIDPADPQFRAAYNFQTDLSAAKKLARFAACQLLWDQFAGRARAPADETTGDGSSGLADGVLLDEAAAVVDEQEQWALWTAEEEWNRAANDDFRRWVHRYLTDENHTPMGWIITTGHYISSFRYQDSVDAFVRWEGDRLTVRNITTTFEQYKRMVWHLHKKASDILDELLFARTPRERPAIAWDKIHDNPSSRTVGYSPFHPSERAFEEHGREYVQRAMERALVEGTHTSYTFSELDDYERVKKYCRHVQAFLDTLFLLVHFSSGEPARLTELLSVQVENSVNNEGRNLFLYDGHVAMVPRYHKGYNRDKSLKLIYRFLPKEVGAMLVHYISLVRPFYEDITEDHPSNAEHSHAAQARSPLLWTNSAGEQYANSLRMADLMRRCTETSLGFPIGPGVMRHKMIAYGREHQKTGRLRVVPAEELEAIVEEDEDEVRDLQAGHTAATAKAVYAVETARVFRQIEPRSHLRVSRAWHERIGFTAAEEEAEWDAAFDGNSGPVHRLLVERIAARADLRARDVLRENHGGDARFRSQEQERVVDAILHGEPAVSYVAGTGSGKSYAFLLPALCPDYKQAIVITPLVSLRTDLLQRCRALAITASLFGDEAFDETARLVLAMPEHLKWLEFADLVTRLRSGGTLERVVLDEFHYIALPDHEYRPALLYLRDVAKYGTPITLLSATVPVEDEAGVYEALGLVNVARFRESTVRGNLRYEVETMRQSEVGVEDIVAHVQAQRRVHRKIVVYLATTPLVEAVAAELDVFPYHGQMAPEDRTAVHREFAVRKRGVVVATTAYSTGIDIPDIDLVQRFGPPDHPIVWLQEGGRGGRDGGVCVVRIVLGAGLPSYVHKLDVGPRSVLDRIMQEEGPMCIRKTVDAYVDGDHRRTCCRADEERCTPCQRVGRSEATATPARSTSSSPSTPHLTSTPSFPIPSPVTSVEETPAFAAAPSAGRLARSSSRTPFTPAPTGRRNLIHPFVAATPDTGDSLDPILHSSPTLRLHAGPRSGGYSTGSPSRGSSPAGKRVLSPGIALPVPRPSSG